MIAHLLSSPALLSGIILTLLLAWLVGSAVMTWRVGKTAISLYTEDQPEGIRRSYQREQASRLGVGSETVPLPLPLLEASASGWTGQRAAQKNADTEPPAHISANGDVL